MDKRLVIRNATFDDTDALASLLETLFAIEADFTFDAARQRRGIRLMLDGCGKHRCIRVAEMAGRVVGMASAQTLISTAEGGLVGLVEDVVVDKNWRGKGIGRRLLASIDAWAGQRGILRLQLLADQENMPAIRFYRTHGWTGTNLICLQKKPLHRR